MMKKLLILFVLLALASSAYAADTDQARVWTIPATGTNAFSLYEFVVTDSCASNVVDTSFSFPLNPWLTLGGEPPYAISLYGVFTEIGANAASVGDCLKVNIDVNATAAAKASATWTLMSGTNGSMTYASRTGKTDTLNTGITDGGSGAVVYSFTANQLLTALPYARIRWTQADAAVASTDSMNVSWYVGYTRHVYK
jgi:hypothetical protein